MYKARIMISIFQGMPRKIPGSYTLVAGFLICQYTFQYTSCILCVTGGILGGTWKVCIRNFTLVEGFLICLYTFQYTSCILCVTGGILGGMYTEFYTCGRIPYMSLHISVYIMYTVCNWRYTGRYVEGVYTEFCSCGRVPFSPGQMSVYCILGKSRGILNVVWKESALILYTVYLVNNDPWFSVGMKFVFRTLSNRVFRNTNIRFENAL